MKRKFGLAIVLLAVVALCLSESESFAGRHRRGGCGSCASACDTGGCGAATAEASPQDAPLQASADPNAAGQPPQSSAAEPNSAAPAAVASQPESTTTYYASRTRARRGWFRR